MLLLLAAKVGQGVRGKHKSLGAVVPEGHAGRGRSRDGPRRLLHRRWRCTAVASALHHQDYCAATPVATVVPSWRLALKGISACCRVTQGGRAGPCRVRPRRVPPCILHVPCTPRRGGRGRRTPAAAGPARERNRTMTWRASERASVLEGRWSLISSRRWQWRVSFRLFFFFSNDVHPSLVWPEWLGVAGAPRRGCVAVHGLHCLAAAQQCTASVGFPMAPRRSADKRL